VSGLGEEDDTLEGEGEALELRPSRSQLHRDASQIYELGLALIGLGPADLDLLDLPSDLRDAIDVCRRLDGRARSRQKRLVAQRLRAEAEDLEALRERFESLSRLRVTGSPRDREAQRWVARFVDEGDPALQAFVDAHAGVDRSRLRGLMRTAGLDPEATKTKRARRELLRAVRAELERG
jgi:ribosome-associated protein